jgi:hypothetical protein
MNDENDVAGLVYIVVLLVAILCALVNVLSWLLKTY